MSKNAGNFVTTQKYFQITINFFTSPEQQNG